jgi:hypothetical protein
VAAHVVTQGYATQARPTVFRGIKHMKPYEPEKSIKYFHKRLFSDGAGQGPSAFLLDVVLLFTLDCQMVNWQSSVPHRVPEASQAENPA